MDFKIWTGDLAHDEFVELLTQLGASGIVWNNGRDALDYPEFTAALFCRNGKLTRIGYNASLNIAKAKTEYAWDKTLEEVSPYDYIGKPAEFNEDDFLSMIGDE